MRYGNSNREGDTIMSLPTYDDVNAKCPLDTNAAVALFDVNGNRVVWCDAGHVSYYFVDAGWKTIRG